MKKVLLGTTALVAAGFVASAASADEMMADEMMMAEPISVSVGGHYFVALGVVSGDDGTTETGGDEPLRNTHTTSMAQDLQIVLSGSTTLDNGMTVGLTAKMDSTKNTANPDGSSSDVGNAHWDERYVTIGGGFGSLQLGSVESARQQTTTFAPSAAGMMGLNTPYFTFTGAIARYDDGIGAEDALKIVYFTPTINGFSIGVSYAPQDSGGAQYGGNTSGDLTEYQDHIAVGATFSQEIAGGSVGLSAGFEGYDAEVPDGQSCSDDTDPLVAGVQPLRDNCDPETVQFGLSLSFGEFSFGGGWQETDVSDSAKSSVMDLGIGWASGPVNVAAMWGESNTDAVGGDAEVTRYGVNGSYALGAGVDIQAQLDFGEVNGAGPKDPTVDYDWVQFMIGTSVSF